MSLHKSIEFLCKCSSFRTKPTTRRHTPNASPAYRTHYSQNTHFDHTVHSQDHIHSHNYNPCTLWMCKSQDLLLSLISQHNSHKAHLGYRRHSCMHSLGDPRCRRQVFWRIRCSLNTVLKRLGRWRCKGMACIVLRGSDRRFEGWKGN